MFRDPAMEEHVIVVGHGRRERAEGEHTRSVEMMRPPGRDSNIAANLCTFPHDAELLVVAVDEIPLREVIRNPWRVFSRCLT